MLGGLWAWAEVKPPGEAGVERKVFAGQPQQDLTSGSRPVSAPQRHCRQSPTPAPAAGGDPRRCLGGMLDLIRASLHDQRSQAGLQAPDGASVSLR